MITVIVSAIMLLCGYLSPYFSEGIFEWLFVFSFIMPYLYLLNLVLFLILIIKSPILSLIPLSVLIVTFSATMSVYNVPFLNRYDNSKGAKLKIITYNVKGFRDDSWQYCTDSIINDINKQRPDVIFFQEFESYNLTLKELRDKIPRLKYGHFHLSDSVDLNYIKGSGNIILSRYPIINRTNIDFENSDNKAQYSNIVFRKDTILLVNIHLQSNKLTSLDIKNVNTIKDNNGSDIDSTRYKDIVNPIFTKLIEGNSQRNKQADKIVAAIKNSKYPIIIGGDFNAIPLSYSYNIFTNKLNTKDPFIYYGKGTGSTFKGLGGKLRIDYILHSDSYVSTSYNSPFFKWSDHNPVIIEIQRKNNKY